MPGGYRKFVLISGLIPHKVTGVPPMKRQLFHKLIEFVRICRDVTKFSLDMSECMHSRLLKFNFQAAPTVNVV